MNHLKKSFKAGFGLEGWFKLIAQNPDGSIRLIREFKNLITDSGLNGIGTNGTSWATAISLGTGTAAPSNGDTALSGTIISVTSAPTVTQGNVTSSPRYSWTRWSKTFIQGDATGTWTEIGIGRSSTALWSRALILDGLGDPVALPIIATDILTVEYELRVYYNETDVTGTRTVSGVSTDYTVRAWQQKVDIAGYMLGGTWMNGPSITGRKGLKGWDGALNANWVTPSGTSDGSSAGFGDYTVATYINASYEKVVTYTATISEGNIAGGLSVLAPMMYGDYFDGGATPFKFGFSPAISKTNEKIMSLTFSYAWARRP